MDIHAIEGAYSALKEAAKQLRLLDCAGHAKVCERHAERLLDILSDYGEEAEQRRIEDFYGASTPQTIDEQHRQAWEEKRRLS